MVFITIAIVVLQAAAVLFFMACRKIIDNQNC